MSSSKGVKRRYPAIQGLDNQGLYCIINRLPFFSECEIATEEPTEGMQKLIDTTDNDLKSEGMKQRKTKSSSLLKKELEAQGKTGSRDFLIRVCTGENWVQKYLYLHTWDISIFVLEHISVRK